jgi:hypothetical protein
MEPTEYEQATAGMPDTYPDELSYKTAKAVAKVGLEHTHEAFIQNPSTSAWRQLQYYMARYQNIVCNCDFKEDE